MSKKQNPKAKQDSQKNKQDKKDRSSSSGKKNKLNTSCLSEISNLDDFEDKIMEINLKKNRGAKAIFVSETYHSKYEGQPLVDALVEIHKKWAKLNEKEKKVYEDLAHIEKQKFEENLAVVKKFLIKKPPKEKSTAFNIFVDDYVKTAIETGGDIKETRMKAREKWNSLSNEEKEFWEKKKEENKDLYDKLRNAKPANINGYVIWVKDQIAAAKEKGKTLTLKECAERWGKEKQKIKEKYNEYAEELKEEKEKQRDLYEITFGIKPRRPLGAFHFYLQEMAKLKKFQGSKFFKEASENWKKLSKDEREKYDKIAQKDRLLYMVKKMEFNTHKRSTFKRAPTSFNLFVADQYKKLSEKDLGNKGVFEYLSEQWKKAKPSVKSKFEKLAEAAKKENEQEKEDYLNRVFSPPKRPKTGYHLFVSERVPELKEKFPNLTGAETFKKIGEEWNKLKDSLKEKWNTKAIPYIEAYKEKAREFEKFGFYTMDEEQQKAKSVAKELRSQMMKSPKKTTQKGK